MSTKPQSESPVDAPQQGATNGQSASDIRLSGDELLLSADSDIAPTLSVVMPTLNEEGGIAQCIEWVKAALEDLQVYGEVVVADAARIREQASEYAAQFTPEA